MKKQASKNKNYVKLNQKKSKENSLDNSSNKSSRNSSLKSNKSNLKKLNVSEGSIIMSDDEFL